MASPNYIKFDDLQLPLLEGAFDFQKHWSAKINYVTLGT
jgi:hypothetical protein